MASGLPDYYRGIDVTYQTLGEIVNRPKYGAAQRDIFAGAVGAGVVTTLIDVAGKGVIYGGHVMTLGAGSQILDTPFLQIDGVDVFGQTFGYLRTHGLDVERSAVLFLREYNEVNYRYSVGIGYGYTFENSLKLRYLEGHARTPDVTGVLHYALI